ncbi:RCC1 domain-containing protein [Effusibacillus dendaii]|uniref:Uncharacterized protein n=1 Tax=Effusibacillus dendaii TaxID=2743772 RepID=A0A7I8DDK7_9BACL|nr:hypothetical protein [Effusibacillus dendaii]BCJ88175.1 hypothetical protein skT53_31600 [Effusibacillus dendaii]
MIERLSKKILLILSIFILIVHPSFASTMAESDKINEWKNLPPVADFQLQRAKKVDLRFNIGVTAQGNASTINAKIQSIVKPKLAANNIDADIQVTDGVGVDHGTIAGGGWDNYIHMVNNTFWSMGINQNGELGVGSQDGAAVPHMAPERMTVFDNAQIVDVKYFISGGIALLRDGTVWYWGAQSMTNYPNYYLPVKVPISNVKQIESSTGTVLMLKTDGTVWGIGYTQFGEIGQGTSYYPPGGFTLTPLQTKIDNVVKLFHAGYGNWYNMFFAIRSDGTVWGWGNGNPTPANTGFSASDVVDFAGYAQDAYTYSIMLLRKDGTIYQWGPSKSWTVPGLTNVVSIGNDGSNNYAVKSDGTVWTWTTSSNSYWSTPVQVTSLTNVEKINTNGSGTFAIKKDGSVWAFGNNQYGQLGTGDTASATNSSPKQVRGGATGSTYLTMPQITYSKDFSAYISPLTYRSDSVPFVIDVSDNYRSELNDPFVSSTIQQKLIGNHAYFAGLGTGSNQAQFLNLITQNNQKGTYIANNTIDNALNQLADYIIQVANTEYPPVSQYILLNEQVSYDPKYGDPEQDPKYAEKWMFTHDETYFENNLGKIPDSGQWRSTPISPFTKTGQYVVNYKVRDNPKNDDRFDNYRLWSLNSPTPFILYVHRRPIADFGVSFISRNQDLSYNVWMNDQSYDPDHTSRTDKGITQWKWSWKLSSAVGWNTGVPTVLQPNEKYLIQLQVKDLEGAWSYPTIKEIDTTNPNLSPTMIITQPNGTVSNPTVYSSDPLVTWTYTDPENDPEQAWRLFGYYTDTNTMAFSMQQTGNAVSYQIPAGTIPKDREVKLYGQVYSKGSWSPFSNVVYFKIHKNHPPIVTISESPNPSYDGDNVNVTVTLTDPDGDPTNLVVQMQREGGTWTTVWTKNTVPSGQSQTFTIPNLSQGTYTLQATATDPDGETGRATASFVVKPLTIGGRVHPPVARSGQAIQLTATTAGKAQSVSAKIDWNQDGRFDGESETVALTPLSDTSLDENVWEATVIIPLPTEDGDYPVQFAATKQTNVGFLKTASDYQSVRVQGSIFNDFVIEHYH